MKVVHVVVKKKKVVHVVSFETTIILINTFMRTLIYSTPKEGYTIILNPYPTIDLTFYLFVNVSMDTESSSSG